MPELPLHGCDCTVNVAELFVFRAGTLREKKIPGKRKTMVQDNRFEERYAKGNVPWDLGRVDRNVVEVIEQWSVKPCRVLDIGCGTGDNSIWLAARGFEVTGIDISELAIEKARRKAQESGVDGRFFVADFLKNEIHGDSFGFALDRGCFHSLDSPEEQVVFARNVAKHLDSGGLWLSLVASKDAPQRDPGPPRYSAVEIATAIEPFFEILSLCSGSLDSNRPDPIRCWVCMMRKRSSN